MSRFRPLPHHVIVAYLDAKAHTFGGVLLPVARQNDLMPTRIGRVLACGSGVSHVKNGETVVLRWSEHRAIRSQGRECRIVREDKILGVIE